MFYPIIEFLAQDPMVPFTIALMIMVMIGILEGVGLILGFAFSSLLDNLVPEIDLDIDVPELEHGAFSEFLSWLRFREVPVIVILLSFLIAFGSVGIAGQVILEGALGFMLPWYFAAPAALVLCLPFLRLFIGILAKIMPRDETEAVSSESLVGRIATITLGAASKGSPAQAKVRDTHGHTHYVMLQPEGEEIFENGEQLLLVRQNGAVFDAIRPDNNQLLDA